MCGITGILHFDNQRPVEPQTLKSMTDIIHHRGPDGEGFYISDNVGLGHRRLSIIDLDTGDQPMYSNDRLKILTFNGEIYNYLELRAELIGLGYHFKTKSDTEVIIKSYEAWGFDCQNKFNGMWAFALWDVSKQELFISRDRIGEKPLFYTVYDNTFIFASEIKSLINYGVPKKPDISLIEIYLVLTNIPEPYSFFKGIKKLKSGHYIVVKNQNVKEYKYWDLPEIDELRMLKNKHEIYENFEYLLSDSIKIRMRSDVPFGAFLSGGLDSSSVVALMSQNSNHMINTFTIGFDDDNFDESRLALDVASKYNTNHFRGTVAPSSLESTLSKSNFHYDEPFGDSSAIPTGFVSKYASEQVKMVLTGDGGDEVLSGYSSYQGVKFSNLYSKLPKVLGLGIPHFINGISDIFTNELRYKINRIQNVTSSAYIPFERRVIDKWAFTDIATIKSLTSSIKENIGITDYIENFMRRNPYRDDFYKLMYINFKHDLPNDYLVKVDRMSMAYSLETRIPFLDYRLIEYMVNVDKSIKLQGWERKSILRNTIGKQLPKSILNAPKKGFSIPLREWFKDKKIIEKTLKLNTLKSILDKNSINKIINNNLNGKDDNGNFIWTLLSLEKTLLNS
jgi:asparagine synthase (glutamine-hydrolysing)